MSVFCSNPRCRRVNRANRKSCEKCGDTRFIKCPTCGDHRLSGSGRGMRKYAQAEQIRTDTESVLCCESCKKDFFVNVTMEGDEPKMIKVAVLPADAAPTTTSCEEPHTSRQQEPHAAPTDSAQLATWPGYQAEEDGEDDDSVLDGEIDHVFDEDSVVHEGISTASEEVIVAQDNLLGALLEMQIDGLRTLQKPWQQLSEETQRDTIERFRANVSKAIREASKIMAARGRTVITAKMGKITIGEEIRVQLVAKRTPEACTAFGMSAEGGSVAFLLLDSDHFLTESKPVKAEPAQRALPLEDSSEEEADVDDVFDEAFLGGSGQDESSEACPL